MCDGYSFFSSADMLASSFGIEEMDSEPIENFNISPSQFVPAILNEEDRIQLRHLHWGLIPSWADEADIGDFMIYARDDSLSLMPCFKHAFKSRRCIIPANGYFEWTNENGRRQPYFISSNSGELFGFAGLWENWTDATNKKTIESFTIITTEAPSETAHLNDRMPVILAKETYKDWLDPKLQDFKKLKCILGSGEKGKIKFQKVSHEVNSIRESSPELMGSLYP